MQNLPYTRSDWRTRALVDAGEQLAHTGRLDQAFLFLVEQSVPVAVLARVLNLEVETVEVRHLVVVHATSSGTPESALRA